MLSGPAESLRNITENMLVNMALQGNHQPGKHHKAYPLRPGAGSKWHCYCRSYTSFDMNSVEKEQYQNVKSSGTAIDQEFQLRLSRDPQ